MSSKLEYHKRKNAEPVPVRRSKYRKAVDVDTTTAFRILNRSIASESQAALHQHEVTTEALAQKPSEGISEEFDVDNRNPAKTEALGTDEEDIFTGVAVVPGTKARLNISIINTENESKAPSATHKPNLEFKSFTPNHN
ncbi:MAG: hypothetical protein M1812_005683 [Candelaria pacifica]|nr:MAG: hypothetical protein M1812_005683 [Candelaria pacifica]